mgnify:CR=1 FL=1
MRCGLIGRTLGHSFSKQLHEGLGRYSYDLIEIPPEQLEATLRSGEYDGLNVTIPYKETVIPLLDELSPRARATGAVNTVVRRGDRLWGDNTDFGGLEALIRRMGLELQGRTVLIAGTGGTSKTAAAVAEALGAAEVLRLSRSSKPGVLTYEEAYEIRSHAQILINTTPVGMYPQVDASPVDLDRLPRLEGVVDVVYNPLSTRLVLEARKRGTPAENGLYMLVAQAMLAAGDFTGDPPGQDGALLKDIQHGIDRHGVRIRRHGGGLVAPALGQHAGVKAAGLHGLVQRPHRAAHYLFILPRCLIHDRGGSIGGTASVYQPVHKFLGHPRA